MNVNMLNSMYLHEVEEKETLIVVNNFKSKKSTDYNNIDMCTVKWVIKEIVQPLTNICNLLFSTGIFPNKMKMAEVIPLSKCGRYLSKQQVVEWREYRHSYVRRWGGGGQ